MTQTAVEHRIAGASRERPSITDITARAYRSDRVAARLAGEPLSPPETMILIRHREAFENRRVLDLGVGSGRTTRYLLPFCADYLGIDLSPEMLAHARRAFPGARFDQGDLRALGHLPDASFEFVMIAYNTIDVLDHDDRLALLREIRRIMAPDGLLVFSSHNRAWRSSGRPPKLPPLPGLSGLPRWIYGAGRTVRSLINHCRLAPMQRVEPDYAIVTGSVNRSGLVYCIDRDAQTRQLRASGFDTIGVYDIDGRKPEDGDMAAESYNLHFVCRIAAD